MSPINSRIGTPESLFLFLFCTRSSGTDRAPGRASRRARCVAGGDAAFSASSPCARDMPEGSPGGTAPAVGGLEHDHVGVVVRRRTPPARSRARSGPCGAGRPSRAGENVARTIRPCRRGSCPPGQRARRSGRGSAATNRRRAGACGAAWSSAAAAAVDRGCDVGAVRRRHDSASRAGPKAPGGGCFTNGCPDSTGLRYLVPVPGNGQAPPPACLPDAKGEAPLTSPCDQVPRLQAAPGAGAGGDRRGGRGAHGGRPVHRHHPGGPGVQAPGDRGHGDRQRVVQRGAQRLLHRHRRRRDRPRRAGRRARPAQRASRGSRATSPRRSARSRATSSPTTAPGSTRSATRSTGDHPTGPVAADPADRAAAGRRPGRLHDRAADGLPQAVVTALAPRPRAAAARAHPRPGSHDPRRRDEHGRRRWTRWT